MTASRLFCFGLGYTASRLARKLLAEGWTPAQITEEYTGITAEDVAACLAY